MKLQKDRYSIAFISGLLFFGMALYSYKKDNISAIILFGILTILPIIVLMAKSSAHIHLTEEQKKNLDIQYKDENDEKDPAKCRWKEEYIKNTDGIKLNGVRYKFKNGTDFYIKSGRVKPCGPGTAFMNYFAGGGREPEAIQNDPCWK